MGEERRSARPTNGSKLVAHVRGSPWDSGRRQSGSRRETKSKTRNGEGPEDGGKDGAIVGRNLM